MKKGEEILLELQSMIKNKTKKPISFWVFQNNAKGERNRKLNLMAGTLQIWGEMVIQAQEAQRQT